MVMDYLLDTNVWIELLRGKNITLALRFAQARPNELRVCSVVRSELMHGAQKYDDPAKRREKVAGILRPRLSLPFDDRCADKYGEIRHDLELRGCVIGPFDLQIAAIALVHDLTVVTNNTKEFKRVEGLLVEDWSVPLE